MSKSRKYFSRINKAKWLPYALIAWTGVLLLLTFLPGNAFPKLPHFMDLLSPDKIIHILLYGVLQYLIVQNLFLIKKFSFSKSILIATLITTPLAALTEILQGILPIKRCMSQYDFIANVMGILLAILILYRQNKKAESPME